MGVRMGDRDGSARMINRLQRGAIRRVRHVYNHADAVHFFNDLLAHAREASVIVLITARRQQGLIVIRELHKAHAELMADFDKAYIVFNGARILEAKEDRSAPRFLRQSHISSAGTFENELGEPFEPAVKAFYLQYHFTKTLVIGYGDVNRVHSPCAHLAEDSFGPVGVLQIINQRRFHTERLTQNKALANAKNDTAGRNPIFRRKLAHLS